MIASSPQAEAGSRAQRGPGSALGNNADFASLHTEPTTYDIHATLPPPATVKAWYYRSFAREAVQRSGMGVGPSHAQRSPRIRWCGSRIRRGLDGVGLYSRPDRAYGRLHGVCVCGQSLACPVCAPRIAAFRSAEVADAFKRALLAGYEARLVTFTIPHAQGTPLGHEIDCFATAWSKFTGGERGVARRKHSLGNHVAREVTHGAHGWHYHHHQLRYDEPGTFCPDRTKAEWLGALDAVGRKWTGAERHAFDVGDVGEEARARYVAKLSTSVEAQARAIGSEIASSATKGKNLATLLAAAALGDREAERTWCRGVSDIVTRKVSSVRWSRGLRAKLGLSAEKTDEQVAAEEVTDTDVFLGSLTPLQWRGVLAHKAEFALCVAANRGFEYVNQLLAGLCLGALNDDSAPAVERSEIEERNYWREFAKVAPVARTATVIPPPIRRTEIC